jgi:hypothetical protein
MCLDTVATGKRAEAIKSQFRQLRNGNLVAYRIVFQYAGKKVCHPRYHKGTFRKNQWHVAKRNSVCDDLTGRAMYKSGFHAFPTKRHAEFFNKHHRAYEAVIARVELAGEMIFGRQWRLPVAVAQRQKLTHVYKESK